MLRAGNCSVLRTAESPRNLLRALSSLTTDYCTCSTRLPNAGLERQESRPDFAGCCSCCRSSCGTTCRLHQQIDRKCYSSYSYTSPARLPASSSPTFQWPSRSVLPLRARRMRTTLLYRTLPSPPVKRPADRPVAALEEDYCTQTCKSYSLQRGGA